MLPNKQIIQQFKNSFQEDFGVDFNNQEAHEVTSSLVGLFSLLTKYHLEDLKKEEYVDNNRNPNNAN